MERLATKRPDGDLSNTIMQSDGQDAQAESIETVYVLNDARSDIKYTMQSPRLRPHACTCHTATQGSTCHHQVAWLLVEYPYGMQTEKLISIMLGQKFGYRGGCSLDDISPLTDALNLLQLGLPSEGTYTVCASSGPPRQFLDSAPRPAEAPVPGRIRLGRHKEWVMDVAARLCAALDAVDPCKQENMIQFQHAELDAVIRTCERMLSSETAVAGSNFCKMGNCNNARKKSFLEKKAKKQAAAQPHTSAQQATQPDNFQVIIKPKTQTLKGASKQNMTAGAQFYQQQYDAKKSAARQLPGSPLQSTAKPTPDIEQPCTATHHSPPKHTPQKQKKTRRDLQQPGRSVQQKQLAQLRFVERTMCDTVRAPLQPIQSADQVQWGGLVPKIWDVALSQGVGASGTPSGTVGALGFAHGLTTPAQPQPIEYMSQQTPFFGLERMTMQPGMLRQNQG